MCLNVSVRDALAQEDVYSAEIGLAIARICGQTIPPLELRHVLRGALARGADEAESYLATDIALFCS